MASTQPLTAKPAPKPRNPGPSAQKHKNRPPKYRFTDFASI